MTACHRTSRPGQGSRSAEAQPTRSLLSIGIAIQHARRVYLAATPKRGGSQTDHDLPGAQSPLGHE
jgi:hypothetical protein